MRLAEAGYPIFEAKTVIPESIKEIMPDEFHTEEEFNKIVEKVRHTYKETNYNLFCSMKFENVILPEYEERYKVMSRYEEQCRELEVKIENLKKQVDIEEGKLKKILSELEEKSKILENYTKKIEKYNKIESDDIKLSNTVKKLEEDNKSMKNKLETICKEIETKDQELEMTLKELDTTREELRTINKTKNIALSIAGILLVLVLI